MRVNHGKIFGRMPNLHTTPDIDSNILLTCPVLTLISAPVPKMIFPHTK